MGQVREARTDDIDGILRLQERAYPTLSTVSAWKADHLRAHQERFPAGQLVIEQGGRIIGFSASFIVSGKAVLKPHTFREITERGTFAAHDSAGDTLYGAEIMVDPDARGRGLGRELYRARFDLVRRLGLRNFVAGGRLPGYSEVAATVPIERYVADVVAGVRTDRVLTPQLRSGLRVVGILPEYLNDPRSLNYAALLLWENPELVKRPHGDRPAAKPPL